MWKPSRPLTARLGSIGVFYNTDMRTIARVGIDRMRPFFTWTRGRLVLDGSFSETAEFKSRTAPWRSFDGISSVIPGCCDSSSFAEGQHEARVRNEGGAAAGLESGWTTLSWRRRRISLAGRVDDHGSHYREMDE